MKYAMTLLLTAALTLGLCAGARGMELVSVAEIYEQAEAMGGVWRASYDAPGGTIEIDAPVIVPDVEAMPVLTVERATPLSDAQYAELAQAMDAKNRAEIDVDGVRTEMSLYYPYGAEARHETLASVWIQRGAYRFALGGGTMERAEPTTYHYPWAIDAGQPCMRGSEGTVDDAMRVWQADIDRWYPDGTYEIRLKRVAVRGSTLSDETGKGAEYSRDGYMKLDAEQVIGGVPLFGPIASNNGENCFGASYVVSRKEVENEKKLDQYRAGAQNACGTNLTARYASEADNRTITELVRTRSVEYDDVPLAPLGSVLAAIEAEIEAGHIVRVYAVRLGYLLYSNPDMTDYAWAIPRWVVDCDYVTKANKAYVEDMRRTNAKMGVNFAPWEQHEFVQMPVDAQSGELIIFNQGSSETFSVPKLITWENI